MKLLSVLLLTSTGLNSVLSTPGKSGDDPRYYMDHPDFSYWNDTNDDVLTEFKTLMTIAEHRNHVDGEYGVTLRTLQRFAELIDMIMYLQRVPFFGQYWYYGCWCAPEGFLRTVGSGYGKPVDAIDHSCRDMSECYECAQMDYGEDCTTAEVNYRWHGEEEDGVKYVHCDDAVDSCQYAICSCDKKLAEDLKNNERAWNLHNHQKWGDFNRDESCYPSRDRFTDPNTEKSPAKPAAPAAVSSSVSSSASSSAAAPAAPVDSGADDIWARAFGGAADVAAPSWLGGPSLSFPDMPSLKLKGNLDFGNKQLKECCGKYPERFPFRIGHNHQCCNNELVYNVLHQECCADGTIEKQGFCL